MTHFRKKTVLLLTFGLMAGIASYAQSGLRYDSQGANIVMKRQAEEPKVRKIKATGRVIDAQGEPVMGATVKQHGTSNATVTDMDGNYTLEVPEGSHLIISYIGAKDREIIAGNNVVTTLQDDVETLNEVIVIGYGSVKKNDLTGSVSAIKPDEMVKGVQTTAQDALQGKIAGVNIISNSGAPGSASTIRIRSGASLSASNDPLIVIDGVPVDNSSIEGGGNVIGGINPNDIESFTVLKDASATAIYGSRASNGVIVKGLPAA